MNFELVDFSNESSSEIIPPGQCSNEIIPPGK